MESSRAIFTAAAAASKAVDYLNQFGKAPPWDVSAVDHDATSTLSDAV